jgi:hypothetical protein
MRTSFSETDLQGRMQRIQDNLQVMHTYFDALFGQDLNPILEMIDDNIELLPTTRKVSFVLQ